MIKLVIFDMDGLLLDSERNLYLKYGLETSAELGMPIETEFLRSMMGNNWNLYKTRIGEHMGKSFPIDEYMRKINEKIFYTVRNEAIPLRPGAIEVLEFCRKEGYLTAIATSTPREVANCCLRNAGIDSYFDFTVTGDEVERGKPNPEIYLKVVDHFGLEKDEAIVLEDGHNGSQAAFAAEIPVIIVEDLAYLTDEDRRKAALHTFDILDAITYLRRDREAAAGV